jgi:hypothetical protein
VADDGGLEGDDCAAARESGRDLRRHHDRHLRRLCRLSLQPYAGDGGGKSRQQFATRPGRAGPSPKKPENFSDQMVVRRLKR